ncbi:MAG TPA: hypothetical protein VFV87_07395, partial [Pirellulaceae bacterium]|nr:hypothetical protein [Pirellulaceae bacterium]
AGRRENWHEFVPHQPALEMLRLLPWSAAVVFVLADPDGWLRGASSRPEDAGVTNERRLLLALVWLLVPLAAAWLLTETDVARLFHLRYLAVSAPAAILIVATLVRLPPLPTSRVVLAIGIVAYALWSSEIVQQVRYDGRAIADRREDWRSAVGWLNKRISDDPAPILVRSGLIEADALRSEHDRRFADYCLLPVVSLYRLGADRADLHPLPYHNAGRLQPDVQRELLRRGGGWLVIRGSERLSASIEQRIIRSLAATDKRPWRVAERRSFGNVQVCRLSLRERASVRGASGDN